MCSSPQERFFLPSRSSAKNPIDLSLSFSRRCRFFFQASNSSLNQRDTLYLLVLPERELRDPNQAKDKGERTSIGERFCFFFEKRKMFSSRPPPPPPASTALSAFASARLADLSVAWDAACATLAGNPPPRASVPREAVLTGLSALAGLNVLALCVTARGRAAVAAAVDTAVAVVLTVLLLGIVLGLPVGAFYLAARAVGYFAAAALPLAAKAAASVFGGGGGEAKR